MCSHVNTVFIVFLFFCSFYYFISLLILFCIILLLSVSIHSLWDVMQIYLGWLVELLIIILSLGSWGMCWLENCRWTFFNWLSVLRDTGSLSCLCVEFCVFLARLFFVFFSVTIDYLTSFCCFVYCCIILLHNSMSSSSRSVDRIFFRSLLVWLCLPSASNFLCLWHDIV